MAILQDDIEKVVSVLSRTDPTTEYSLKAKLLGLGLRDERASVAVNEAQYQGRIRWAAFEGWLRIGRP